MSATVHVKLTSAPKITVGVELSGTVLELKELLAEKTDIPAAQQRLIYKGHVLKDEKTLESYGGDPGCLLASRGSRTWGLSGV